MSQSSSWQHVRRPSRRPRALPPFSTSTAGLSRRDDVANFLTIRHNTCISSALAMKRSLSRRKAVISLGSGIIGIRGK